MHKQYEYLVGEEVQDCNTEKVLDLEDINQSFGNRLAMRSVFRKVSFADFFRIKEKFLRQKNRKRKIYVNIFILKSENVSAEVPQQLKKIKNGGQLTSVNQVINCDFDLASEEKFAIVPTGFKPKIFQPGDLVFIKPTFRNTFKNHFETVVQQQVDRSQ
mmetsp:Transcript_45693/g.115004  ORF Transcript_45693/g.115004 Transcript_45693/m.115004 type:complete len:159 (+) Transcript_45693:581-1057(+)